MSWTLSERTFKPKPEHVWSKGRIERKLENSTFIEDMRKYNIIYLFSYSQIRNRVMRRIIAEGIEWKDSKIWLANNKVVHEAISTLKGKHSWWTDLQKLSNAVRGKTGLLLTNRGRKEVEDWFNTFSIWDYPHPGYEVDININLRSRPLPQFYPEIEPYLRQLGMPTTVVNGVVTLTRNFEVCRAGTILTIEQVRFLELLGKKLSVYKLRMKGKWTKQGGLKMKAINEESESEAESDFE